MKFSQADRCVISFAATKPPAHPESGDRVGAQNRKPSHPDAAVCSRNLIESERMFIVYCEVPMDICLGKLRKTTRNLSGYEEW